MTTRKSRQNATPAPLMTLEEALAASPIDAAERRVPPVEPKAPPAVVRVMGLARNISAHGYALEHVIGRGPNARRVFYTDYLTLAEMRGFAPAAAGLDTAEWTPCPFPRP